MGQDGRCLIIAVIFAVLESMTGDSMPEVENTYGPASRLGGGEISDRQNVIDHCFNKTT